MMAEAAGKLTGLPGICLVTRAPGATNASPGLHIAMHDSTPLVLLVGQVERNALGREAFQELDYRAFFGGAVKWVTEIDDACRIPELISRAFHVATSGRAGPVVVSLPEDMLKGRVEVQDARPYLTPDAAPAAEGLASLRQLLSSSERPLVIAGGSGWDARAVDDLVEFAERQQLPVAVSFRRQMLFPASHPHFVGDIGVGANPALIDYARDADMVLLLGGRLSRAAKSKLHAAQRFRRRIKHWSMCIPRRRK